MYPTKIDKPLTGLDWLEWYGPHNAWHPGLDFNTGYGNQDLGNEVVAPRSGFVEYVYTGRWHSGFGKFVIIHHNDGSFTRYAHLQDVEVKQGKEVQEGQLIGHVGNTGTTYAHLHFEVFNEKLADIQKGHWRRWRYYPSGKTKNWVMQHYINPWQWLDEFEREPIIKWHVENKIIEKWPRPASEDLLKLGWTSYKIAKAIVEKRLKKSDFNL